MADDRPKADKAPSAPLGNHPAGADQLSENLKGIAPRIMEAFLTRQVPATVTESPERSDEAPPDVPPASLETWPAAVLARRQEIQALLANRRPEAVASPDPGPTHADSTDPASGLARGIAPHPDPEPSGSPPSVMQERLKAQHLALRATEQARPEAAPGAEDPVLRRVLDSLRDQRIQGRLAELTESINRLVPGGEGTVKLGTDIGKKVLVDNLNPVLALSLSTREAMQRIDTLKKWHALSGKQRLLTLTALTGSLAEILGALTPPPVNVGVQVVGAGLSLMTMAAEHSETLETMAKQGTELASRQVRRVMGPQAGVSAPVQGAWQTLNARLAEPVAPVRPVLGAPLRWLFASGVYQALKRSRWSATVAVKLENLAYNLAAKRDAAIARVWQWWRKPRRRPNATPSATTRAPSAPLNSGNRRERTPGG